MKGKGGGHEPAPSREGLRTMVWLAALFLLLGLTGLLLQGALGGRGWRPDGAALAASPCLGAALLGTVLVLGLVFFDRFLDGAAILLPVLLGAAWAARAVAFPLAKKASPAPPPARRPPAGGARPFLPVLVLFTLFLLALTYKDGAPGDYLSIWALKALVLAEKGSLRIPSFLDWRSYHPHQDYPILFPALQALLYRASGADLDRTAKLLYPLLLACAAAALYFHLLRRSGRTAALAGGLLCLTAPGLCGYHPGVCSAYMDVPLGIFLLLAVLKGLSWLEDGRGRDAFLAGICLGGACLTKNEGMAYAVPVMLFFSAAALRSGPGRRSTLPAFLLPALAAGGTWFLFRRNLPAGDSDYAALFTSRIFLDRIHELPAVCARFALELVHFERWGFLWILVVLAAPRWYRRGGALAGACLAAVTALQAAAVTVSPLGIEWQTASALSRLAGQAAPLAALLAGLAFAPAGEPESGGTETEGAAPRGGGALH